MDSETLSFITAFAGFLILSGFCIYKYVSQDRKYGKKYSEK